MNRVAIVSEFKVKYKDDWVTIFVDKLETIEFEHFDTLFSEDDILLKVTKKLTARAKQIYRKEMSLVCNVSKNEINLNSNGLGHNVGGDGAVAQIPWLTIAHSVIYR